MNSPTLAHSLLPAGLLTLQHSAVRSSTSSWKLSLTHQPCYHVQWETSGVPQTGLATPHHSSSGFTMCHLHYGRVPACPWPPSSHPPHGSHNALSNTLLQILPQLDVTGDCELLLTMNFLRWNNSASCGRMSSFSGDVSGRKCLGVMCHHVCNLLSHCSTRGNTKREKIG